MKTASRSQPRKSADPQMKKVTTEVKLKTVNHRKSVAAVSPNATVDLWSCRRCYQDFADENSELLECESCQLHYCIECLEITPDEYAVLTKRADVHWYCSDCEANVMISIRTDRDIAQRCSEYYAILEQKLRELHDKMDLKADKADVTKVEQNFQQEFKEVGEKIHDLQKTLQEKEKTSEDFLSRLVKVEECIELHLSDDSPLLQACKDSDIKIVQKTVDQAVSTQMAEDKDIANRKRNLVIYRVPESEASDLAAKTENDKSFVMSLFNEALNMGIQDCDINRIHRLGSTTKSESPRPLMVKMQEEQKKWDIMKNLKKLQTAPEVFRKVSVANDLTVKQRLMIRSMVLEAKDQHDQADTNKQDGSENYRFLVVGLQSNPRVIKTRRLK